MTARRTWKQRETDVANFFQGQRTPLSGGNSKITRSDVIHDELYIECKLKKKHSVVSLWDETKKLAKEENKTMVVQGPIYVYRQARIMPMMALNVHLCVQQIATMVNCIALAKKILIWLDVQHKTNVQHHP